MIETVIPRINTPYPKYALSIFSGIAQGDILARLILGHHEVGMGRIDSLMLHEVDVELCQGIIMILALVAQCIVESEQHATVFVFTVWRFVDVTKDFLLRQGAAPDTEVVEHAFAAIPICIA